MFQPVFIFIYIFPDWRCCAFKRIPAITEGWRIQQVQQEKGGGKGEEEAGERRVSL